MNNRPSKCDLAPPRWAAGLACCVAAALTVAACSPPPRAGSTTAKRGKATGSSPKPASAKAVAPPRHAAVEEAAQVADANPFEAEERARDAGLSDAATHVDAIAADIFDSLARRPVLIVWLFDATSSAATLRERVVERLLRDYTVFGRTAVADPDREELRSAVVAFGEKAVFLTPEPTGDVEAVARALKSVSEDSGNTENTMAAISQAAQRLVADGGGRLQYVMFVVVTDEAGDDADAVDELAERLTKARVSVSVIGPEAPFGSEGSLSPLLEIENWRPVRQGPESRQLELVSVAAVDRQAPTSQLASGNGPFALNYLALKTAGRYFIVRPEVETHRPGLEFRPTGEIVRFDPRAMAEHAPDYVTRAEYEKRLGENRACAAVCRAARFPAFTLPADLKRTFAQKDPAALKRELDQAQRDVAKVEPHLRQLYDVLAEGEADRARLTSPRWRANYDLAMGRVLADRARWEGYNSMLATLKSHSEFTQPGSTRWVLTETDTYSGNSTLNKLARRGREYLERVVAEHAATPWSWLAERELKTAMAWKWVEQ